MGATDFYDIGYGKDAQAAFNNLVDQASHEHGHGGYTGTIAEKGGDGFVMVATEPMTEVEAFELAHKAMGYDSPGINGWTTDKWGPAACIPIVRDVRQVPVTDFEYIHDSQWRATDTERVQPSLLEAVKDKVKLRKGESIQAVTLSVYSTPDSGRGYYGGSRPTRVKHTGCSGTVTIKKPPTTRIAPICIEIPGGLDWDAKDKEIAARVATMRLKPGEKVIAHRATRDTPGKAKVTVTAPKGKALTRFVVKGSRAHATWETGFESQAAARAWATDALNDDTKQFHDDVTTFEVESVTRREDGQPLVSLVREVGKRIVDVDVTVKLPVTGSLGTPDAWLFFGMASE